MLKLLLALSFVIYTLSFCAQDFEGTIFVEKKGLNDTVNLAYNVKGKLIRVDEIDESGLVNESLIIDVENKRIVAVKPQKKLYRMLPSDNVISRRPNDLVIKKSTNYKLINGFKCYQWRVKSVPLNTEVSYWIPEASFSFFSDMLLMLNSSERSLHFFMMLPLSDGFMPMLAVERTLLRKEKKRFRVTKVLPKSLQDSLFKVPNDYQVFNQ